MKSQWNYISLYACSIGAYFSLNAYADKAFNKCPFQSPILDLQYLMNQMFIWFSITKDELYTKQQITTPLEVMTWDYYEYVMNNPIVKWDIPTSILYGSKDDLQSNNVINDFTEKHNCKLTISNNSEHYFTNDYDINALLVC